MSEKINVTLGGGIAGLIWGFYHRDYTIVTKDVGGQMAHEFNLGPRYLHKTENAKKFLIDLGIDITDRKIRVGYVDDSGFVSPDETFRRNYFMKSRQQTNLDGYDPSVMNSNHSDFGVYEVDFRKLIETLFRVLDKNVLFAKFEEIDADKQEITISLDDGVNVFIQYDNLVSTIPLCYFLNKCKIPHDLKSFDVTYCLVNSIIDMDQFDFIYDCRTSTKFHRITRTTEGQVLDFFGYRAAGEIMVDLPPGSWKSSYTLKSAQIISVDTTPQVKGVKFVGRYGTWNRSWKTEKVIDEAMNG